MRLSVQPRLAAVIVIAGWLVAVSCHPARPVASIGGMTEAEQTAALALTSWVNCVTVRRVAATGVSDSTNVEICADTGAKKFGPNNGPGGVLGKPIARMRNLPGGKVERRWKLQPGSHYYHVWITGPAGGPTRWTIKGQGVNVSGPFRGCGYAAASVSRANFGDCMENPWPGRPAPGRSGPSDGGGSDKPDHPFFATADGPAWISCREGCCTTDAQ